MFWIVFSAFFFGLSYGLLQLVTERTVFRRERSAGLRVGAYVAAKITVLLPFLAIVDLAMVWVLERGGLLPSTSPADMCRLWGTLTIVSAAALAVGLAASALVRTPAQATLALPMLVAELRPDLVVSGHVHEAPFADGGDRAEGRGPTVLLNAGQVPGPRPAHLDIDLDGDEVTWRSRLGGAELTESITLDRGRATDRPSDHAAPAPILTAPAEPVASWVG